MKKLAIIFLVLSSCTVQYRTSEKAYQAVNVYQSVNTTVHQFLSLSGNEYCDYLLDSAYCKTGDTVLIKTRVKSLGWLPIKHTYFFIKFQQ